MYPERKESDMEYTVHKLSKLAGISERTLRYYDEINLLKPARISSSGYRIYGRSEVDRLQQILFYRELGVSLDNIKEIMGSSSFHGPTALKAHHEKLLEKREQLNQLIANVEKTIAMTEGRIIMSDKEKFEGFKKNLVNENEQKYGEEVRKKYGNNAVDKSNQKLMNMSQDEYKEATDLAESILENLKLAMATGDPSGDLAQEVADMHKRWICLYWADYSKEAHAVLAQMYVDDERFTAYYDKEQPGAAKFLRDAILVYTGCQAL
jgi:DNA-binding transcriptional MerR regulator